MVAKKKPVKYTEIGDELSVQTAFIQASCALDVAAFIAEENRDVKGLLSVAQTYVALGERLHGEFPDSDEEEKAPFGFSTCAIASEIHDPEIEDVDEEGGELDEPQD